MPKYPYRNIGAFFDRLFRNDLNQNFSDIEQDFKEQKVRVDNLLTAKETAGELEDLRQDNEGVIHPIAKDRFAADAERVSQNFSVINTEMEKKAGKQELNDKVNSISDGTPEALADLTAIQNVYPTGSEYVKLNLADGYIYKWDGVSWVQGWQYQSNAPVKAKDLEVLPDIPTDLYDGRMWVLANYTESADVNTLSQSSVMTGAATYGTYDYMNDYIYIPIEPISLTKASLRMTSRDSTLHTDANDIRVRLCKDDGAGLPDLSNPMRTVIVTGNPATADTVFTAAAVFADESNNFANKVHLQAGERYHFVMDIPTGTGNSFYSGFVNTSGTNTDKYAQANYSNGWTLNENNIPSYAVYRAVIL